MPEAPTSDGPRAEIAHGARAVLDRNRRGTWTCPSQPLYPHQWLWDSCFVAIGLASVDPVRAADELRALFRGQWANGMLPHVIFAEGTRDAGSRAVWQSRSHPEAPRDVETSCITQPPLVAIAAWHVAQALPAAERREFLAEVYPKLVRYHRWLYDARDPRGRGLVTLIHPWECGLDTTPPWMEELGRMPAPWWLRAAVRLRLARGVRFLRRDTRYVPAAERASDDDGLRMLVLARRAKRHGFELAGLPPEESVLVEDVAFNSLLVVANRSLGSIATDLGFTIDADLAGRFDRAAVALEELWDDAGGQYCSRNATTGRLMTTPTVAMFLPLWAGGLAPVRVERLLTRLRAPGFWPRFPAPSVPLDAPEYDANRYWKGPTWVNTNWMVIQGLRERGATDLADDLVQRTLDLVEQAGFAEYFSAQTGEGFGADAFSWSAALTLALL